MEGMDDENEALMEKEPSNPSMGQEKSKDNDNGESTYCSAYCRNCAAIILLMMTLFLLIIIEIYHVYAISHNIYFDDVYLIVYLTLFGLILIVLIWVTVLLFSTQDTQKKYLKWLVLSLSILFLLIGIWVIVYIKVLYTKSDNFVYVNGIDLKNKNY